MDDIGSKVVDSRNKVVDKKGNIRYFNEEGKLHSEGGRPSIEWRDGSKQWHANGKQHRDGGLPAVEHIDGSKSWWVDNERHRDVDCLLSKTPTDVKSGTGTEDSLPVRIITTRLSKNGQRHRKQDSQP